MKERAASTVAIDGVGLRRLRMDAFLSQHELGVKAGVREETVNRLERGVRAMTYRSTVRKLADALGVEPRELLRQTEGTD